MLPYALTILLSAFLLFQVQPLLARAILAWFGGSAGVWTVCLLFFQVVLLLGYLYAHALARYLRPRSQMLVHCSLLLVSLFTLPVYPRAYFKPAGGADPAAGILLLLAVTVGLPYFLLSSTGPLLQAWYARRFQDEMPYRLYALSNAGSLFALLSYPVLFEPFFGTRRQAWIWSAGYACFALLCAWTADRSAREAGVAAAMAPAEPPRTGQYVMWLALPACATALLLALTNHMTQNVAAIPFLWVLPLSIYLLSFVLCFAARPWYRRKPFLWLLILALWTTAVSLDFDRQGIVSIRWMVPLLSVGLFACCMACHGELVRLRPHPRYLTHFYVSIAAGGAAGGILVGLVAPHVFNAFYELPLALVACGALVLAALFQDPALGWSKDWTRLAPMAAFVGLLLFAGYLEMQIASAVTGVRARGRNFYGGLTVQDYGVGQPGAVRKFHHGTIDHGEQFLDPEQRWMPISYYGPETGIAKAILEKQQKPNNRVGVLGLGGGTLAAFGRAGDTYRFYEINPLVLDFARQWFTFLADARGTVDVVLGDGRLSLESEEPQGFDVLAIDAFSGDAIPVHLVTREAIELYFRHLKPDGILAIHISNRYLDVEPVLAAAAAATGKFARLYDTDPDAARRLQGTTWVLMTSAPVEFKQAQPLRSKEGVRLWTDDYSNLFRILK